MKKTYAFFGAILCAALLTGCAKQTTSTDTPVDGQAEGEKQTEAGTDLIQETVYVEMDIENYGKVVIELDGEAAPITVTNFVNLTKDGFYDGLTFHRIMEGFMIQGGDPTGTGSGGSGTTIKGEFRENGYDNPISHKTGVISMARNSYNLDSASSQFFICVADDEFLDGSYAAFGKVVEGMDVVMKIASDAEPIDDNGTIPAKAQPKITYIKVIDRK